MSLWSRWFGRSSKRWEPSVPGRRFQQVILYTKQGCHLCEEAAALLSKYSHCLPPLELIDIESETSLYERFHLLIPVIEIDGKIRFKGRIPELALRRLIEGSKVP